LTDQLAEVAMSRAPAAAAEWCRELLAGEDPPPDTRANLFLHSGDYLSLPDDHEGAGEAFRAGVSDGCEAVLDARAFLTAWCFENGDRDRVSS
jgi:hypothetical protein